jgi:hypothetical protein
MPIRPKKKSTLPKKVTAAAAAQEAVDEYEEERSLLLDMKASFRTDFPDANVALQNIMRQEDLVQDKIKAAIPLIRDARQDVGDFKCQIKRSTPNYDDKEFASLVTGLEEGGDVLIELLEEGYVKVLKLDPSVANYFAQHPQLAEHFKSAWRDAQELTPAVTAPKL